MRPDDIVTLDLPWYKGRNSQCSTADPATTLEVLDIFRRKQRLLSIAGLASVGVRCAEETISHGGPAHVQLNRLESLSDPRTWTSGRLLRPSAARLRLSVGDGLGARRAKVSQRLSPLWRTIHRTCSPPAP